MPSQRMRLASATVAPLVLVLALAACPPSSADCRPGEPASGIPAGATPASTIAVLAGVTASDGDQVARADRAEAFGRILDAGLAARAHLMVGNVSKPGDARLAFDEKLAVSGVNPQDCENHLASLRRSANAKFGTTTGQAVDEPPDVLGAIANLSSSLERSTDDQGIDVVIMSSMLHATEDLRLDRPGDWARDPAGVIARLRSRGLISSCQGWRVYVVSPGRTAGGGPDAATLADLRLWWDRYFAACGGRLWRFQSQLVSFPVATPDPAPPAPPGPCGSRVLASGLFFDAGAFDLRGDADPALEHVLEFVSSQLSQGHGRSVDVAGHTDADGEAVANQLLSERRALAVARWLEGRLPGGTSVRAFGYGEEQPVAANDSPDGKAQNRRVEITVSGC